VRMLTEQVQRLRMGQGNLSKMAVRSRISIVNGGGRREGWSCSGD